MDFGYAWPWTYGHLIAAIAAGLLAFLLRRKRWPFAILMLFALWGFLSHWVIHQEFLFSSPLEVPLTEYVARDAKVIDIGAGSGRAAIGLLRKRPDVTVTALDIFAQGYGIDNNGAARLLSNAKAAGLEGKIVVQEGDMRKMPLPDAAFDHAISAYAIDHLNGEGASKALAETHRVLKPGGTFLLLVVNRDNWLRFVFPLAHSHYFGAAPAVERWRRRLLEAKFAVLEEGRLPGTLYMLVKRDGSHPIDPR